MSLTVWRMVSTSQNEHIVVQIGGILGKKLKLKKSKKYFYAYPPISAIFAISHDMLERIFSKNLFP